MLGRLATAVLVAIATMAPGPSAWGQPAAAAEQAFRDGRRLMAEGRYAQACEKFEESQQLDPAAGTLLNLGDCYEKMGRTASAWSMFREAQAAARRASHPQRAEEADRRAKDVELRLTRLAIIVARPPPGLVVALDDNPVTALLGSGIPVDPGSHVIQSSAPGYQSATRRISVEPTPGTLEVRLAELRPLPPSESIARPSRRRRHMTPVAWGLAIGGGAALAAGAIFDATAYADYRGCRDAGGCATDDQVDGIRNRLIAGDLLLGLGLATIGAAAVVYWRSGGPEPSGARVGASLDRGQATVLVHGRF